MNHLHILDHVPLMINPFYKLFIRRQCEFTHICHWIINAFDLFGVLIGSKQHDNLFFFANVFKGQRHIFSVFIRNTTEGRVNNQWAVFTRRTMDCERKSISECHLLCCAQGTCHFNVISIINRNIIRVIDARVQPADTASYSVPVRYFPQDTSAQSGYGLHSAS